MDKVPAEDLKQIEKLSEIEDFQVWKFQITIILLANELIDVILEETPEEERNAAWKKKDANAKKVIVITLDKKPLLHVMGCKTAYDMWKKIISIYERDSEQQKCTLLQNFFSFNYEKNVDLSTNIARLRNLATRMNTLEDTCIDDNMLSSKILAILPDEYKHFTSAWESTIKQERTLENLISRLLIEETRNSSKNDQETPVAFKTTEKKCFKCGNTGHISKMCKNKNIKGKKCYICNKEGHFASKKCTKKSKDTNLTCTICKKDNHVDKDCYFRNKDVKKQENRNAAVSFLTGEVSKLLCWVIDSGTTSHMTKSMEEMQIVKKLDSEVGLAKTNTSMKAKARGNLNFQQCELKNVLYTPDLSINLLSVNAITNNGGTVIFNKTEVLVEYNGELIFKGEKSKIGLYEVRFKEDQDKDSGEVSNLIEDKNKVVEEWHKKLGHASIESMKKLLKLSNGMNLKHTDFTQFDKICEVCLKARQTRQPFKEVRRRAQRPLEIIHTDLCGPINPKTWDGKEYFLTFLDDYTHLTIVYLLKSKNEVFEIMKEYVEKVENYWNMKIAKIRCDNGREYANLNIKNWCKKKGIELDFTIPYSPQLNGKAERLNRTLMERARALIFDSKMKKEMWGEAIYSST
ncbi:Copia protein [Cyphomyrmex costatus]|uniref:Copia protein n=1 Tax=Cyphomyrmex costatus TaxID=456900 RepID=A0A151II00_9HYME|nr:Copia protein [Cyphomyrmex costatus]